MERQEKFSTNTAYKLLQSFPGSSQTDTVVITIYDVDDAATDVNGSAMTAIGNESWSYNWTPTEAHTYLIKFRNSTLDVNYFLYALVEGQSTSTPSGGLGSTSFQSLRQTFLKLIDQYNSNDTGTNSSDEIAGICINKGLQTIYSLLKASRYLQYYASTALSSTADQAYIELSGISDLDEIVAVKDTTNDITLIGISPERYFREVPDASAQTGTSYRYCRIFNRIYLDPRPTGVINYTVEYLRVYPELVANGDAALLPPKFDDWIYKEARVQWAMMEDAQKVPPIYIRERDDAREIYMADALTNMERNPQQSRSNFGRRSYPRYNYYDHI